MIQCKATTNHLKAKIISSKANFFHLNSMLSEYIGEENFLRKNKKNKKTLGYNKKKY